MIPQTLIFFIGLIAGFTLLAIILSLIGENKVHPDTELFEFQREHRIDVNYWPENVRHPGGFTCYDPEDSGSYDFEVFDTPQEALREMIRAKQRKTSLDEVVAAASTNQHAS